MASSTVGVSFVGPGFCGKTTLVQALARALQPGSERAADPHRDEARETLRTQHEHVVFSRPPGDEETFLFVDSPADPCKVANMVRAINYAPVSLLVLSAPDFASEAVAHPPRTYALLLQTLAPVKAGRPQAVAVTRMDEVGYDEAVFARAVECASEAFSSPVAAVPVSGTAGDNVTEPSANLAWWQGPTLLDLLRETRTPPPANAPPASVARLCVGRVWRNVVQGRITRGTFTVGQQVAVRPGSFMVTIERITHGGRTVESASAGALVGVQLSRRGLKTGTVLCGDAPPAVASFRALLKGSAGSKGRKIIVHVHGASVECEVKEKEGDEALLVPTGRLLHVEPYADQAAMGRFVFSLGIDRENHFLGGAGKVLSVNEGVPAWDFTCGRCRSSFSREALLKWHKCPTGWLQVRSWVLLFHALRHQRPVVRRFDDPLLGAVGRRLPEHLQRTVVAFLEDPHKNRSMRGVSEKTFNNWLNRKRRGR